MDSLDELGERLYLQGEPFTGIAYEVADDRVVANYLVSGGVRGGQAEAWDPARPRVLFQALTSVTSDDIDARHPRAGEYLDGMPFGGVSYTFDPDTGTLLEEQDFDPEGGPGREWYPSGALLAERERLRPDGLRESLCYDEGGRITAVAMDRMGWDLTPEMRLRTLRLNSGYPDGDIVRVPPQVDARLRLSGEGITDHIVAWLDDLPRLERLVLDGTRITASGLAQFGVCVSLRELVTLTNPGFIDDHVRVILTHLTACKWDRR